MLGDRKNKNAFFHGPSHVIPCFDKSIDFETMSLKTETFLLFGLRKMIKVITVYQ